MAPGLRTRAPERNTNALRQFCTACFRWGFRALAKPPSPVRVFPNRFGRQCSCGERRAAGATPVEQHCLTVKGRRVSQLGQLAREPLFCRDA